MRIVSRKEFAELPAGTVYSHYEPCVFTGLFIKGETWFFDEDRDKENNDFLYQDLIGNVEAQSSDEMYEVIEGATSSGKSFNLKFDSCSRDGAFDYRQKYAIYEKQDLSGLINCLVRAQQQTI